MHADHQAEFNRLSKSLIELATSFVEELGSFAPFGGCIRRDGQIAQIDATSIEEPADAIAAIARQIRELESDVGMILVDTRITDPRNSEKTDCIMFIGEHRAGMVLHGFLPYSKHGDAVQFAQHFTTSAKPMIFPAE